MGCLLVRRPTPGLVFSPLVEFQPLVPPPSPQAALAVAPGRYEMNRMYY